MSPSQCLTCGIQLVPNPEPGSHCDNGFCSYTCALKYYYPFTLLGQFAVEIAMAPASSGGPAFEITHIRDWLNAGTPDEPFALVRAYDYNSPWQRWNWQLRVGPHVLASRLTLKRSQ